MLESPALARDDIQTFISQRFGLMQSQDLTPVLTPITVLDVEGPSTLTSDPFGGREARDFKASPFLSSQHAVIGSTSVTAGLVYTFGIYVKEGTKRYFTLQLNPSGLPLTKMTFDIQGPTVLTVDATAEAYNLVDVGNGWVWASLTATALASLSTNVYLIAMDDPVDPEYTGAGFQVDMSFARISLSVGAVELLPLRWDNLESEQPQATGTESWARITLQHNVPGAHSMGAIGERRFTHPGLVFIQIFTPRGQGVTLAEAFAKIAADALEGVRTPGGAWFSNTRSEDIDDAKGLWHQTNVVSEFRYDEIK